MGENPQSSFFINVEWNITVPLSITRVTYRLYVIIIANNGKNFVQNSEK